LVQMPNNNRQENIACLQMESEKELWRRREGDREGPPIISVLSV
jgi:hypothetical protein